MELWFPHVGFPVVRCPSCSVALDRAQLSRICPEDLSQLDEALTNAWLEAKGIIRCPNSECGLLIEKLPAEITNNIGCTCANSSKGNGSTAGGCAACWKQQHRYRCSACGGSFCDSCWKTPYHVSDIHDCHPVLQSSIMHLCATVSMLHGGTDTASRQELSFCCTP